MNLTQEFNSELEIRIYFHAILEGTAFNVGHLQATERVCGLLNYIFGPLRLLVFSSKFNP